MTANICISVVWVEQQQQQQQQQQQKKKKNRPTNPFFFQTCYSKHISFLPYHGNQ